MGNSPGRAVEIMVMSFGGTRTWSQPAAERRLDWRWDLNYPTYRGERRCVNSARTADPRAALFEHDLEAATPIPVIGRPFDALAEGLPSKNSRGDWTRLELFIGGVRDWDAGLRRILSQVAG